MRALSYNAVTLPIALTEWPHRTDRERRSGERLRRLAVAAIVQTEVEGLTAWLVRAGKHHTILREADIEPAAARLLVAAQRRDVDQDRRRGLHLGGERLRHRSYQDPKRCSVRGVDRLHQE